MANKQVKTEYLNDNIFYGLEDLNNGFDSPNIKYFSEKHFEIVLDRVEKNGLGIYGIEPWENDLFYNVLTYEDFTSDPCDPKWYWGAFNRFRESGKVLQYAASYYIPEALLEDYK